MPVTAISPSARNLRRGPSAAKVPVVRAEDTRTVVVLRGEADSSTRSVLSDVLSGVLVVPAGEVVIDLTEATLYRHRHRLRLGRRRALAGSPRQPPDLPVSVCARRPDA